MVLQSLVHPAKTLEELNNQRQQNIFTDITILVSDEKFPAHRSLLAAHSSLFRSVLQESAVVVDNAPNINLDGVDATYFSILLDFIYTSKLCVSLENVDQVSATSEFLQISSVVELCEKFKQANAQKQGTPQHTQHLKHDISSEENSPKSALSPKENSVNSCVTDEKTQIEIELSESGVETALTNAQISDTLPLDNEQQFIERDRRGRKNLARYKCPLCEKIMTHNKLQAHIRTHNGEKIAQCSYCNRSFANIYNLRIHERTHTGERPYKCPQCDKTFADPSTLCKHKLWHAGVKKKNCPLCKKLFSTTAQVKEHMKTHTKEKPFQCPHCDKSYAYKCDFKRHLRNHTGDLFGPCIYCGRYFNHGGNYKVHLRNHEKRLDKIQNSDSNKTNSSEHVDSIFKVDDLAQLMSEGHSIEVMIDGKLLVKPATTHQASVNGHSIVMSQSDELVSATVSLQQDMTKHEQLLSNACDVISNDCDDALVIAEQVTEQKF